MPMDRIELAPRHKIGLPLRSPLILAAGTIGYGDARPRALDLGACGAWVTAPIGQQPPASLPEDDADAPRRAEVPGGVVLAPASHPPSASRVLRRYAPTWPRLGLPVIAHLAATARPVPEEAVRLAAIAQRLASAPGVAALELALDVDAGADAASALIAQIHRVSDLPLLAALPLVPAIDHWAIACAKAGADALVVGQPPLAAAPTRLGTLVRGQLYGPAVAPLAWEALTRVAALGLDLPLVGAGGVHQIDDILTYLRLGATAVQIDTVVWIDPECLQRWQATAQWKTLVTSAGEDSKTSITGGQR